MLSKHLAAQQTCHTGRHRDAAQICGSQSRLGVMRHFALILAS